MRIVFRLHNSIRYAGGGELTAVKLSKFLRNRGHDVRIIGAPILQDNDNTITPEDLDNYSEPWLAKIDADITLVIYHPLVSLTNSIKGKKIAALWSSIPFIWPPKMKAGIYANLAMWSGKLFNKRVLSKYDGIQTVSNYLFKKVKHSMKYLIGAPVDNNVFMPRRKFDNFTVIFVGRHTPYVGFPRFVKLARELKRRGIKTFASGNQVSGIEDIEFLGWRPAEELGRYIAKSHLLIQLSQFDSFGGIIPEAMSCGTPVVTTPIQAHLDLNMPSLLYATRDEEFLSQIMAIRKIYDTTDYDDLSRDCYLQSRMYSMDNIGSAYEDMFEDVLMS